MSNADISRLLGEVWRGTSVAEKRPFLEREEVERKIYKAKMEAWKNDQKFHRSMKSTGSTLAGDVSVTKSLDQQRQDDTVSSFTRGGEEESFSRYAYADPDQRSMSASYPMSLAAQTSNNGGPYNYEYVYNNPTMENQHEWTSAVKYSYPRPSEG